MTGYYTVSKLKGHSAILAQLVFRALVCRYRLKQLISGFAILIFAGELLISLLGWSGRALRELF